MKAPPIVAGVALGVAGMAALAVPMLASLDRLAAVRGERTALRALLAESVNRQAGASPARAYSPAALAALVARSATRGGLLVEEARPLDKLDGVTRVRFRVSGREGAAIALADSLERDAPLACLATWRIERAGGAVRLTAEVVAP